MAFYRCEKCGVYSKSENDSIKMLEKALNAISSRRLRDKIDLTFGLFEPEFDTSHWQSIYQGIDVLFMRDHYSHLDQIIIQEHDYAHGTVLL